MADAPRQEPFPRGKHRLLFQVSLTLVAIVLMANLSAVVDFIFHPEIQYFDEEHLFVGAITGLMTGVILFGLMFYINRLDRLMHRQEQDQKALAISEEKYRAIFESSIDVIFLKTPGGKFIDINPAGVSLFGYDSREELLSLDISEDIYVSYNDWAVRQQIMERDGFVENYELEMKKKSGDHIHILETATAVYDAENKITAYQGIMRDVTAQKQLEMDLSQAQKLESIGRMAGGIAHDFNNYLTTISGQTEMAARQVSVDSPIRESLNEISGSIDKASKLTRQLLLFSRNQPLNMEPVDLKVRMGITQRQLSDALGEKINVQTQPGENPCIVDADTAALSQVLVNLALSSRRRMPQGGNISIFTEHIALDEEYAMAHVEAYPGNFICVGLRDDGEGLDEEDITHFFEPFYGSGTDQDGMVLAAAYGIVVQHGGWINIDSAPGMGTTYRIFLPASEQEVRRSARVSSGTCGRGERILLVEDEEAVRATVKRMLSDNGYEVLTAGDAETAFDLFVRERGDIQLVFSDVMLPGESGVELVEHLRSHKADLAVVLSSGYTDRESDLDIIREKEYRFLQKPFSLSDLLETVRETLEAPASASMS